MTHPRERQGATVLGRAVVVGSGTMGTGIVALLAETGWAVALVDADIGQARSGRERVNRLISERVGRHSERTCERRRCRTG